MPTTERYVPAAGRPGLNALYDPVMALTMRERAWRPAVIKRAAAARPATVVDIGCGTGTLTTELARALPAAAVIGVDGDPAILAQAAGKTAAANVCVELREGRAQLLPLPDDSADIAVMSLLLHHLTREDKLLALREARRVLRGGGRLLIADWGRPGDPVTAVTFFALRLLDGWHQTADHAAGRLPGLITTAGFGNLEPLGQWTTVWGRLTLTCARKPG